MRRFLPLSVFAMAFLFSCVTAKRVNNLAAPEGAAPSQGVAAATEVQGALFDTESIDLDAYFSRYDGYKGVRLYYRNVLEHLSSSSRLFQTGSWSFFELVENKYMILDTNSEDLTTFNLKLGPNQRLKTLKLYMAKPGEPFKEIALQPKVSYDSDRQSVYKLAYEGVEKGTMIIEQMEITYHNLLNDPPLYHDIPLQFDIPCEKAEVSYAYPDWWRILVKQTAENAKPPWKTFRDKGNNKVQISYSATNVPAVVDEPFSPYFKQMASYLEIQVRSLYFGDTYYNGPPTWMAFAENYRNVVKRKDAIFSNRVSRTAKEIVGKMQGKVEKMEAIVGFIQSEITLYPEEPAKKYAEILNDKRANLFQLNALTQRMLNAVEVNADFVLIHSAEDGYFDPAFISAEQLYIPGLRVNLPEGIYILFPYLKNLPIDHVPEWLQGQPALVIREEGAKFENIPKGNHAENGSEERYEVVLDEEGGVVIQEHRILRGSEAFLVRQVMRHADEKAKEAFWDGLLSYTDGEVQVIEKQINNMDDYKQPLQIELKYKIQNLVTITPDEILFNTAGLFSPASENKLKMSAEDRRNPIVIPFDKTVKKHIELRFPKTWRMTTELENTVLQNVFGEIEGQYIVGDGVLTVDQRLVLNKSEEPKEAIDALLDITGADSKLDIPTLVFEVVTVSP